MEGLIFISPRRPTPPDFEPARELMAPLLRPQGFDARQGREAVDYEIAANWKLVWENNRECFHCNVNHPQYIKANFDHYNADDTSRGVQRRDRRAVARSEAKWAARAWRSRIARPA